MSAHDCKELTAGCYRCELNRDEIEANRAEDEREALTAWYAYRNSYTLRVGLERGKRQLRRRDFIAGFMAGRDWS